MELHYVDAPELTRLRGLEPAAPERAAAVADACRINTLYMIARAGSGHIGTSFSSMDVLTWLQLEVLGPDDLYFSSKGHDAPGLYAVLAATGAIDFDLIHRLRRLGGVAGHPDVVSLPAVVTNTGSLGMGISKAKGFVRAARLRGEDRRVFVLTGDGELQEGQFWESLQDAANSAMHEITVIVDRNRIQSDTWVSEVSDLGDLERKLGAFGWAVESCDGNDAAAVAAALERLEVEAGGRPRILVADTLKGAGVSFMEPHELPESPTSLYAYHSGAPSPEDYEAALEELTGRLNRRLEAFGADPVALTAAEPAPAAAVNRGEPQRLIGAYGQALAEVAAEDDRVIALDADLVLDTGLIPFRDRFSERFVEAGIAEQDMVSQAGAMALAGLVPVVHSFACFLSTRPNEQIYNNSTEATKVIYVGSLAGLVPGGPGHSHQSVRDISALGAMPGIAMLEPSSEHEAALAVRWAVEHATGPVYIRLVSVPWSLGFTPPTPAVLTPGRGEVLREGRDITLVAAGPVMVSQAWSAAEVLAADGVATTVVALPWLCGIDGGWLADIAGDETVVCLENHYAAGGQGDAVRSAFAEAGRPNRVVSFAVDRVPVCGTNEEVLKAHRLDAESVAERVQSDLRPTR